MDGGFIRKAAILQAYMRVLEENAEYLDEFQDMQLLRDFRAQMHEFIKDYVAAGMLPENPLAVVLQRLRRLDGFLRKTNDLVKLRLAWKLDWLESPPLLSMDELLQIKGELEEKLEGGADWLNPVISWLDESDWDLSSGVPTLPEEYLECAVAVLPEHYLVDMGEDRYQPSELYDFCQQHGRLWDLCQQHLIRLQKRVDEFIAMYAEHEKWLTFGDEALTKYQLSTADEYLKNIEERRFLKLDYTRIWGEWRRQRQELRRYRQFESEVEELLLSGQVKLANAQYDALLVDMVDRTSELGQQQAASLRIAEQHLHHHQRAKRKRWLRVLGMVLGVGGLLGMGVVYEIVREKRMHHHYLEAKNLLPDGIHQGHVGKTIEIPISEEERLKVNWCPAGEFTMGSPMNEKERGEDEGQVTVHISRGFWMGQTEVTQAQWKSVMETNPSDFEGDLLPVEKVSWDDAQEFITRINRSGVIPDGWKMALPTEAQWEYACRAGEVSMYSGGKIDQVAWYDQNSGERTHRVGRKKPNAWGLYDMHGNVWEWCSDWYGNTLSGGVDPTGPKTGTDRVRRGGSWFLEATYCRSASRVRSSPEFRFDRLGFRVAIVPSE